MMTAFERAKSLGFWSQPVNPVQIKGGITNANFRVDAGDRRYFVRIGDDIPVHGVMRFNELAASHAAARCGLSPQVRHAEPGALVFDFIEARTYGAEDVRKRHNLERILPLIQRCHHDMPRE
ncbi:MAG TPA: choline/ethanolamine kinase family protein, partial [Terriglobales bacterium]|nr:choline/ethanolamine kinase family protein [Terriglobales bacterium]